MPNPTGEARPTSDPHPGPANPPPVRAPSKQARARKRSGPPAKSGALRLRPMCEDAARYTALWDRMEMLVIAFLQDHWRPAPALPDAEPDDEAATPPATAATGRKSASGSTSSRSKPDPPSSMPGPMIDTFAPLCPPDVDLPLRPGPPVRELASVIVCLRRIQDARFALDQKSTGDSSHESEDFDSDPNLGIPERRVRAMLDIVRRARTAENEPEEE